LASEKQLEEIYQRRFSEDIQFRQRMWKLLCREFFQKYIPTNSTVLELAAGYCEFINNIQAGRKIAVDLNSEVVNYADKDVQVTVTSTTNMAAIPDHSVNIAFTSNFFEHLTRDEIVQTIREVRRILVKGGQFLVLQPNIRFCQQDYWMFFDHITPLDDRSLSEALETNGFKIKQTIVRFLPYTTKSRLPKGLFLIKAYLKIPLAWRFLGQQSFIVAQVTDQA